MRQYIFDLYISLLRTRLGMVNVGWLYGRPCYTKMTIDDDRSMANVGRPYYYTKRIDDDPKVEWLFGRPYYNTIRIDDDRSMAGLEWCSEIS